MYNSPNAYLVKQAPDSSKIFHHCVSLDSPLAIDTSLSKKDSFFFPFGSPSELQMLSCPKGLSFFVCLLFVCLLVFLQVY